MVIRGLGVYYYDGKSLQHFTTKEGLNDNQVFTIYEDKNGNIWLGGGMGLWRYDGSTFTQFAQHGVNYVYEDKKGNIWTSGSGKQDRFEVARYDAKSLHDKKPVVTKIAESANLFGFLEANDGSMWFGAFDGVYRYDGNTVKDFK